MHFFTRPSLAILVVCTANICRSPMAEGILRAKIVELGLQRKVAVKSAGTHASQLGRAPDPRAERICRGEGIDIRKFRARQIKGQDFERYDHILAMDSRNYEWLLKTAPEARQHKISLIGSWIEGSAVIEIPDPYYGNQEGFTQVFAMLDRAAEGFLARNMAV